MLPYILALIIAIYSLILFGLAFFAPVIHRKDDFLWSGIGLFYALVLWLCAGLISGAVLLGQSAATILLISFGWQTVKLRRAIAYPDQSDQDFSVVEWMQNRFLSRGRKKPSISSPTPSNEEAVLSEKPQPTTLQEVETLIPPENEEALASSSLTVTEDQTSETLAEEILETALKENIELPGTVEPQTEPEDVFETPEVAQAETVAKETPKTLTEFPQKAKVQDKTPKSNQPKTQQKKGFSWKNLLGFGKKRPSQPTPETVSKAIAQSEADFEEEPWNTPESTAKTTPVEEKPVVTPVEVSPEKSSSYEFDTFVADEAAETVIEGYRSDAEITQDDSSDYQFDTLVADEGAETVIENYQPELDTSRAIEETAPEDKKIVSPTQPIELEETQPSTDKNDSEVKDEKIEKSE